MPVSESSNICHMIINTTFLISQNYTFSTLYYSYFPGNADMQPAVKGRIWAFASSSLQWKQQRTAAADEAAEALLGPELQKQVRITRGGVSGTAGSTMEPSPRSLEPKQHASKMCI